MNKTNHPKSGKLGLTTWSQVIVGALAGVGLGWLITGTVMVFGGVVGLIPWTLAIILGASCIVVFCYSRMLKRRLGESRHNVKSQEGVVALVLGKMMVLTGAFLAGAHTVYALLNLTNLDAVLPQQRLLRGLITAAICVVFSVVGSLLEHVCLIDQSDDDDPNRQAGMSTNPA